MENPLCILTTQLFPFFPQFFFCFLQLLFFISCTST
uniref:Uncharacterized protein n=1 Tax=Rhizophora mucronata TaxID=61149 RepID=A0A2P2MZB6_RHIMU